MLQQFCWRNPNFGCRHHESCFLLQKSPCVAWNSDTSPSIAGQMVGVFSNSGHSPEQNVYVLRAPGIPLRFLAYPCPWKYLGILRIRPHGTTLSRNPTGFTNRPSAKWKPPIFFPGAVPNCFTRGIGKLGPRLGKQLEAMRRIRGKCAKSSGACAPPSFLNSRCYTAQRFLSENKDSPCRLHGIMHPECPECPKCPARWLRCFVCQLNNCLIFYVNTLTSSGWSCAKCGFVNLYISVL